MTTKFYKKYLITKGLCGYNKNGEQETVLLEKPTIDKAIDTIKLKPVYIGHDNKEQVGEVVDLYFDVNSANFICGFNVWDEKAQNLLDNENYAISSTYQILEKEEMEDKYHNMNYKYEVKDLVFMNIAIVKEPRYQEAKIMLNSIDNDIKENGGPGSGNFGHAGRPGKRGGSSSYGSRTLEDLNNLANRFKEMKKEGSKKFKETLKRKIEERLMNNDDLRKRWEEYKLERIETKQKEVKEIGNIERKERQDKESIDIEKGDKAPIQEKETETKQETTTSNNNKSFSNVFDKYINRNKEKIKDYLSSGERDNFIKEFYGGSREQYEKEKIEEIKRTYQPILNEIEKGESNGEYNKNEMGEYQTILKSYDMNEDFWDLYKSAKEEFKDDGYNVIKDKDGNWEMIKYKKAPTEEENKARREKNLKYAQEKFNKKKKYLTDLYYSNLEKSREQDKLTGRNVSYGETLEEFIERNWKNVD